MAALGINESCGMNAIPYPNTRRYQMMLAIKDAGPMTADQVMKTNGNWHGFTMVSRCTKELNQMVKSGCLIESDGVFALSDLSIAHFDGDEYVAPEVKLDMPLTPPAYVNIWTPAMRGYEASLRGRMRA